MQNLTSLAQTVGTLLIERKQTLAVSESSSGGLISAALLSIPGASAYFMGGGVIYTHRAREVLLDIDFKEHPGVRSSSEPYALLAANPVGMSEKHINVDECLLNCYILAPGTPQELIIYHSQTIIK